ncbi:NPC intracellular cholesterol transporter 2-like [Biomphalaria glabrata]|uniref:NPC intracellular cholesterol transporter 2-like n=1 Tax=Biomphalaria glabrata TaxID=6526 RepID=A0A9W2ZX59_BIOGL|nr:NPC intracellular cholesterol transporter 2-like [Biomphalaria glabrata]XP_055879617.1 NPC intracellular cholesterol transporter 2-like [Biomphalaria glabrata]
MKLITFLVVLFSSACWVKSDVVTFKDCGSELGTITQVDITPCSNFPCPFRRNAYTNITVKYTANSDIVSARTSLAAYIAGMSVTFPLRDSNACHSMTCPIKNGDNVVYKSLIFVPEVKKVSMVTRFKIQSASRDIVCFTFPVTIVD